MRKLSILLAILACACSPKVLPPASHTDSVRVEIRERIVHDTAILEVPKVVEKNVTRDTSSHLENDWAKSDAEVKGGFLWHSLESKPQIIKVPVAVPVHDTTYIEKEAQTITEIKEVEKPLTWWQRFRLGAFWWLLVGLVGCLVWIFRKPLIGLARKIL